MVKRKPRAGTERLTVAWLAALVAIGAVVVIGTTLLGSTLRANQGDLDFLSSLAAQRTDSERVAALANILEDPVTEASGHTAASELENVVARMVERGHELDLASVDSVPDGLGALHSNIRAGLGELQSLAANVSAHEAPEEVASAITAANTTLQRDMSSLDEAIRRRTADDGQQAERVNFAMLVGVLLLLLVEALLVFLPATRRLRKTMERRRRQQEAEREHTREQLERLARFDHLTGLANRSLFRDRLEHALAAAERSGQRVGVMFLDLDRFKVINDQYGHDAGDQLLVAVAGRLQGCARKTDTVARLGGDEFTLILENLDTPDGAANVAQKITESLRAPIALGGNEVAVTTSIGIAVYPDDGTTIDALLREADSAMYHAKSEGRNTFQFSTPELRASNMQRLETIAELRESVARGELRLVYQPQVRIDTGQVVGVEAFVRWERPDGTEVPAGEFIDLAEDTDLMVPLGDWVLREACRQSARWVDEGLPPLRIAVNLSPRQFHHGNLAQTVASVLTTSGTDPSLLELEITEDTLVSNVEASSVTLRLLRGIGVRVVIDDFGTGYSSLSYLRSFPIDALKIDRSFIDKLSDADDEEAAVVPAAITGLARHLNLETVAEGVETKEQVEFLRRVRCDVAQGYHFSAPVEANEIPALVRRRTISSVSPLHSDAAE